MRERLEQRRDRFVGKALNATNRWTLPELRDDEGVQTRLSEYPTVQLVILRALESRPGVVGFTPLDGEPVEAIERLWSLDVARALFRNQVRVPKWWLRNRTLDQPGALRRYFLGEWAWAVLDGEHLWLNGKSGEKSGLKYLPDRGVWCELSGQPTPASDYDSDEDDNW